FFASRMQFPPLICPPPHGRVALREGTKLHSYMPSSSRNRNSPIDLEKCVEIAATCACFNFRKVSRTVTQLFDQVLAPLGLRSTQLVILVAAQVFGPVGMTQLARELLMDRSTITRNLRPLVAMGLLKLTGKSG